MDSPWQIKFPSKQPKTTLSCIVNATKNVEGESDRDKNVCKYKGTKAYDYIYLSYE